MQKKYYLKFDHGVPVGSAEHFFHFMWGYLLPSMHKVSIVESTNPGKSKYLFRSCGPVMDKIIKEAMSLYNYDFSIVQDNPLCENGNCTQIIVPRWDIWLVRTYFMERIKKYPEVLSLLAQQYFKSDLSSEITEVKTDIAGKIIDLKFKTNFDSLKGCYLILKRSPEPEYYENGGKAEIPTYGTSRRALTGIEDAGQYLRQKNIPIRIFEPGKYSWTEQIKVFQHCEGIIGIKGAEFANLIWMKAKSKVIMIKPSNMDSTPYQKELANILGLDYIEIVANQGNFPILDPEIIERIVTNPYF